ncbi:MAG: DUF2461 domain-containing protein [Gammaproteobacteria bacterium]|nr:DUF2461 domain-containing protein [Gammaproteobacteria bacterium]
MAKKEPYFTAETFRFLRQLAKNNDREWFAANKPRFEARLRQPYLRLIADLAAPLRKLSPHYVADPKPVGGSLFRIHRDTRFSSDKSPYKLWAGSQYFHAQTRAGARERLGPGSHSEAQLRRGDAKGIDAPVFYLHLQPGECFAGGGLWHPQPESVKRVRDYMVGNPRSWKEATRGAAFRREFELGGDALSRPPRSYDPQHELIEDLKRKDFVASATFADEIACRPDFDRYVIERFRRVAPMVDWLCGALDLEF